MSEPSLPPPPPPQPAQPPIAQGPPPAKRFTWKHGCILAIAGLVLAGGSFFVCLAAPNSMNGILAPVIMIAFLGGLLICALGCLFALILALLR